MWRAATNCAHGGGPSQQVVRTATKGAVRRAGANISGALVATVLFAGVFVGCSSDESASGLSSTPTTAPPLALGEAPLRVEQITDAVAAVEAELGAPQQFFEVNATPTIVNLFLAVDDATAAVAYVYAAGELNDPSPPQPASGPTFGADDIAFDETTVLALVRSQLSTSNFRLFSITGIEQGGVQYQVVIESTQGTEFVVYLSGNGAILGTDQNLVGGGS